MRIALLFLSAAACGSNPPTVTDDAWRGFGMTALPAGWEVEGANLHFKPSESPPIDLITVERYRDFELSLEWKVARAGNSGIFFRVGEEQHVAAYESGPEMQILDDAEHPDGADPKTSAAANYALHAPSAYDKRAIEEYNDVRLIVVGAHVEHWINGSKVVEYELDSDTWRGLVAASKFAMFPAYATYAEGHIALQDHGDEVWFRNVKIEARAP